MARGVPGEAVDEDLPVSDVAVHHLPDVSIKRWVINSGINDQGYELILGVWLEEPGKLVGFGVGVGVWLRDRRLLPGLALLPWIFLGRDLGELRFVVLVLLRHRWRELELLSSSPMSGEGRVEGES